VKVHIGPDAARYLAAADGVPVSRPFFLRWSLPWVCGSEVRAWWWCWGASWVVLAGSMIWWRLEAGDGWRVAFAACVLLLALPGILGPSAVIPVGVDLPATALTVLAVALLEAGDPTQVVGAVFVAMLAGTVKETAPIFAALFAWHPVLLVGLVAVGVRWVYASRRGRIGPDPLGAKFQQIADHPVRASFEAHAGQWRNAWIMAAPWGVCLAALYRPSLQVVVALVAAYALVVVATDTVRLYQHAAGPVLAVAAANNLPTEWLLFACVVHAVWWVAPQRI
jgi:hypothetical protein